MSMDIFVPETITSGSGNHTHLSPAIWGDMPILEAATTPWKAHFEFENWLKFPITPTTISNGANGAWAVFTSATAGPVADAAIANNSALTFAADDDNEAIVLVKGTGGIRITADSGRKVAFECRAKLSNITDTKAGQFFGLFEWVLPTATSHIADAGTLVDKNFIGFHKLEGDGDQLDFVYKADGQTQQSFADSKVLVADTFVRMGFKFDGVRTLKVYFNGVEYTTARLGNSNLTAVTFPSDINLAPALVPIKNAAGSTPQTCTVHWAAWGFTKTTADLYP